MVTGLYRKNAIENCLSSVLKKGLNACLENDKFNSTRREHQRLHLRIVCEFGIYSGSGFAARRESAKYLFDEFSQQE